MKNKISIVMPLYNKERYISSALSSIVKNTTFPIEVIVVDDFSSDRSAHLVQEFVSTYVGSISFVLLSNDQNEGPLYTRLRGVSYARGDYIAFLDADDTFHVDFISSVSDVLDRFEADIITVAFFSQRLSKQIFDSKKFSRYCSCISPELFRIDDLEKVLCQNFILGGGNVIAKRQLFDSIKQLPRDRIFEDWWMWMHILSVCAYNPKIVFLDRPLYIYNDLVSDSLTNNRLSGRISSKVPDIIRICREGNMLQLSKVVYWCWITSNFRRIGSIKERLVFFRKTGFHYSQVCVSRYFLSAIVYLIFGKNVSPMVNFIRKKSTRYSLLNWFKPK